MVEIVASKKVVQENQEHREIARRDDSVNRNGSTSQSIQTNQIEDPIT